MSTGLSKEGRALGSGHCDRAIHVTKPQGKAIEMRLPETSHANDACLQAGIRAEYGTHLLDALERNQNETNPFCFLGIPQKNTKTHTHVTKWLALSGTRHSALDPKEGIDQSVAASFLAKALCERSCKARSRHDSHDSQRWLGEPWITPLGQSLAITSGLQAVSGKGLSKTTNP